MFTRNYLQDLGERSISTFVQAAAGIIIATGSFGVDVWKAAAAAGILAVMKGLVARGSGDPETAGFTKASKK